MALIIVEISAGQAEVINEALSHYAGEVLNRAFKAELQDQSQHAATWRLKNDQIRQVLKVLE